MDDLFFMDNPLPMWVHDPETYQFLEVNDAATKYYGYSIDEFKSMTVKDILPPEDVDRLTRNLANFPDGAEASIPWRHIKKDGSRIDVEMISHPIEFNDRNAQCVVVMDVTERVHTREQFNESQAHLASVIDSAMDAIISVDEDYRIVLFNPAAEKMFQCPSDQALGQPIGRFIPKRYRSAHREYISNFGQTGKTSRAMGRLGIIFGLRTNGEEFPIEASISHAEFSGKHRYTVILRDISERLQAEKEIQRQLKRLKSLREIDLAITSSFDLHVTLDIVLRQVLSLLNVNAAAILLFDPHTQTLRYASDSGFRSNAIHYTQLRLGEGFAGRAILDRKMIHIPDLKAAGGPLAEALQSSNEGFVEYYGVPLIVKGEIKGVMEIYHRSQLNPDPDWLDFLNTLSTQTAIAIDSAQLFDSLQQTNRELEFAYHATIEGWSHALDLRDKETEGHTKRVTEMTLKLARLMEIPGDELVHIRRGALLHDIGKMGVPDGILFKAESLTEEEWKIMKKHPVFAYEMLSPIRYLMSADIDIPYCHHEKWDGTGYPRGLERQQIPITARIFAIADVWDALTSDRPYRPAWSKERAVEYIREQSGKQFDPQVVAAFLMLIS